MAIFYKIRGNKIIRRIRGGSVPGSLVVRASNLGLNGRQFDPRPPHYRSVVTETDDSLRVGKPSQAISASYPLYDRKKYRPKCGDAPHAAGSKGRMLIPPMDKRVRSR